MSRGETIPDEIIARMRALRKAKCSIEVIAKRLGYCPATVSKWTWSNRTGLPRQKSADLPGGVATHPLLGAGTMAPNSPAAAERDTPAAAGFSGWRVVGGKLVLRRVA